MFLTLPLIFLLNKRNKALWCGLGQLVAALANLLPLLAWLAVPTTYAPTAIARDRVELCPGAGAGQEDSCEAGAGQPAAPPSPPAPAACGAAGAAQASVF